MSRILIAPWGNPFGWTKVKYEFRGKQDEAPTTLPLLRCSLEVDKVVLIVLDSLAEALPSFRYEDVKREAERRVRCFLAKNNISLDNVDVVVSYSVGKLGKYQFDRELKDFYAHILWELGERLLEVARCKEEVEIYLDLTHGINYMPTLVYRAVRKLGSILALTKRVSLTVLNSETPKKDHSPDYVLKIHTVSKTQLQPLFLIRRIVPEPCKCDVEKSDGGEVLLLKDRRGNGGEGLNCRYLITYDALSSAVQNGLPLLLLDLLNRSLKESTAGKCAPSEMGVVEYAQQGVENCFRKYEESISYSADEHKFSAKYSTTSSLTNWIQVAFLLRVLKDSLGPELCYNPEEGISLERLTELAGRIWRENTQTGVFVFKNLNDEKEQNKIKKRAKECKDKWRSYARDDNKACKYQDACSEGDKDNIRDFRNFIAHSGITYNTIEIKEKNGRPWLRYCNGITSKIARDLSKHLPE